MWVPLIANGPRGVPRRFSSAAIFFFCKYSTIPVRWMLSRRGMVKCNVGMYFIPSPLWFLSTPATKAYSLVPSMMKFPLTCFFSSLLIKLPGEKDRKILLVTNVQRLWNIYGIYSNIPYRAMIKTIQLILYYCYSYFNMPYRAMLKTIRFLLYYFYFYLTQGFAKKKLFNRSYIIIIIYQYSIQS